MFGKLKRKVVKPQIRTREQARENYAAWANAYLELLRENQVGRGNHFPEEVSRPQRIDLGVPDVIVERKDGRFHIREARDGVGQSSDVPPLSGERPLSSSS